jgi:hypothetical protein
MRILLLTALCALAFLLQGCTKKEPLLPDPACKAVFKAAGSAASIIGAALQCENTGAITGDISGQIVGLGLCADVSQQSVLSDVLCPQVAAMMASMAAGSIPKEWSCSATAVTALAKAQAEKACAKIIR